MWSNLLIRLAGAVAGHVKQRAERHAHGFSVVATGHDDTFRWVAVPEAQAQAFKAAYPKAASPDVFFSVMCEVRHSQPRAFRHTVPFANELAEAVDTYGDECRLFVIRLGG